MTRLLLLLLLCPPLVVAAPQAAGLAAAAAVRTESRTEAPGETHPEARSAAVRVMEAFLVAFNARDETAWADTLHFPHVRLASQTVTVYDNRAEFLDGMDLDEFAATTGWRYSRWDDMSIVQASDTKVHVKVQFSRFDAEDKLISTFDSLYIIEQIDGRWGVRARSSFAP